MAEKLSATEYFAATEYVSGTGDLWTGQNLPAVTNFSGRSEGSGGVKQPHHVLSKQLSRRMNHMEFSTFPLFVTENLKNRPQDFVIDIEKVEEAGKKMRAARDAANPPKPEPARAEYNRLRQQLFDAQRWAKDAEIYCNDQAGNVRLLEQRINDLLKKKKQAIAEGKLGDERICEHQLQLMETELIDAKQEFHRATRQSAQAARALKAFDDHERIAELKKQLDESLPYVKSVIAPK